MSSGTKDQKKQDKRAAALRENLRRRKDQKKTKTGEKSTEKRS